MPSLKDIRRRIGSVKKTQQITRAMRMVAAARLRRAQEAIVAARPYAERLWDMLRAVAAGESDIEQPLLVPRDPVESVEVAVLASDRGLCGAFNANVLKAARAEVALHRGAGRRVSLTLLGRKAVEAFRRAEAGAVSRVWSDTGRVEYAHAAELAAHLADRFCSGAVDAVTLIHSEFVSAVTQTPRVVSLLPLATRTDSPARREPSYSCEPDPPALLRALAPATLEVQLYRALLDSQAAEYAARMAAMEAATRNTEELIEALTLEYNRARQAAITVELVEIVSGAEAL